MVRQARPPARPATGIGPADPDRLQVDPRRPGRRPRSRARRGRGRPGLPVDRQRGRVPRDLRPRAARPQPPARRQPRDGSLGARRLPAAAALSRRHDGRALPAPRRRLRPDAAPPPRPPRRARPLRHRLRRRRPRRGATRPPPAARRPLRRLVRELVRAVVHGPPSRPPARRRPRLHLPGSRPRPLVRVVRRGGAPGPRRGLRARSGVRDRGARQRHGPARGARRARPQRAARRRHARRRRQPHQRARRPAHAGRHGPGRRLRPGDLPRARRVRPRGPRRRRGSDPAPRRPVGDLRPRREHRRLLLERPVHGRELHGLPDALLDALVAAAAAARARGKHPRRAADGLRAVHASGVAGASAPTRSPTARAWTGRSRSRTGRSSPRTDDRCPRACPSSSSAATSTR
jgi:hypothetical protein